MTRDKKETCRICGKVKGVDDSYYLLPRKGRKTIGRKLQPNSKETLENKRLAEIVNDSIEFHGASIKVNVHNSYKSRLLGDKHEINIAADRRITVKERGIQCNIDKYLIPLLSQC